MFVVAESSPGWWPLLLMSRTRSHSINELIVTEWSHVLVVRAVVDAQNTLTESVLAQCETRDRFKALMTQMYDYPRFGCAAPS